MNQALPLEEAIQLLQQLIACPSFSREEQGTADLLEAFLLSKGVPCHRLHHNIWTTNRYYQPEKPTLLLNSHHDTVRPNSGYRRNPFQPSIEFEASLPFSEKRILYGLGSTDAGGALVALLFTFLAFYDQKNLPYNLVFAATAEEEISGTHGIECLLPHLGPLAFGLVGEPTNMQMAVAERGLLVIDGLATGRAGHAAREEGENALYKALDDLQKIRNYTFPKVSDLLGPVKVSATQIQAGVQHNIVPDTCTFTLDVRVNERYDLEEVFTTLQQLTTSQLKARSLRLRPSCMEETHPLVQAGVQLGLQSYGSPTCSDQALLPFPSLKIGPGESARSHTADEFIYIAELTAGLRGYSQLLQTLFTQHHASG